MRAKMPERDRRTPSTDSCAIRASSAPSPLLFIRTSWVRPFSAPHVVLSSAHCPADVTQLVGASACFEGRAVRRSRRRELASPGNGLHSFGTILWRARQLVFSLPRCARPALLSRLQQWLLCRALANLYSREVGKSPHSFGTPAAKRRAACLA